MGQLVVTFTAAGWTHVASPVGPHNINELFWSDGNDGTRDMWIMVCYGLLPWPRFFVYLQDDAAGTHTIPPVLGLGSACDWTNTNPNFLVYIAADKDCFTFALDTDPWGGGIFPFPHRGYWVGTPRPPIAQLDPDYEVGLWEWTYDRRVLLRNRTTETWADTCIIINRPVVYANTNANNYDPNTYFVWPYTMAKQYQQPGGGVDVIGDMGLLFYTNGAGIAHLDTITVGPRVYTVIDMVGTGARMLAMRSV